MSAEHQVPMSQQLKALLEEGHFEKALLLARACYYDEELGEDQVFLETALILCTNMEKLDLMWSEIQKLKSMEQILPVTKSLRQYYIPAALLTAEMLLSKEWCTETVSLSDLQQVTDLWIDLLWSECGHDKEAFEAKVRQVSAFVLYEPVFILKLVRAIHRQVGKQSLVFCVNLCLSVFQEPASDPQSNLFNACRIDLNNAALCRQLFVLFEGDMRLQRLCLLTAFTITPTMKLFEEVDKLYRRSTLSVSSAVPLLPSCLSCVLFQTMNSFLPDSICPLLDWKVIRLNCLKYLRHTSQMSMQVRLPERDIAVKMFVKKMPDEMEDSIEETNSEKPMDVIDSANTLSKRQWLSTMMSLDMSWQPYTHLVTFQGNKQKSSSKSCLSSTRDFDLIASSLTNLPRCSVVLQDCEELLMAQNISNPLIRKQGLDPIRDNTLTASVALNPREQSQVIETKSDIDTDSLLTLRTLAALKPAETSPEVSSEMEAVEDVPDLEVEPLELCGLQQQDIRQDVNEVGQEIDDGRQDIEDGRHDSYDKLTMHSQEAIVEDDSRHKLNSMRSLKNDHVYSLPVSKQKHFLSADEFNLNQDVRNSEREQNLTQEISSSSEMAGSGNHVQQFNSNSFAEDQVADQQQSILNLERTSDEDPVFFSEGSDNDEFYSERQYTKLFESSLDSTRGSLGEDAENYTAESFLQDSADNEIISETPLMQNIYNSTEIPLDMDTWFQNFDKLPQASLMEEDVLSEPAMDAEQMSAQWAAIKEVDGIVDPASHVLNWNEMDSWLEDSIVHCHKPAPYTQAFQTDSVGLCRGAKPIQKTKTEKCKSLQNTISRLRATFVDKDDNFVGINLNGRDSTSPLSEANSSTTQSSCQEKIEQQPIDQPWNNPQGSDQYIAGQEQSMSLESVKQQSPHQQLLNSDRAASSTLSVNSTNQQLICLDSTNQQQLANSEPAMTQLVVPTEEQLDFFESVTHESSCEQLNTSDSTINSVMENDSSQQNLESIKQQSISQCSADLNTVTCLSPNVDQSSNESQLTHSPSTNLDCIHQQPINAESVDNSSTNANSVQQEQLVSLESASQPTVSSDSAIQNPNDQQQLPNHILPGHQLSVDSQSTDQELANKLPTFEPQNEIPNNSDNQGSFEELSPNEEKHRAFQEISCCQNESSLYKVEVGLDGSYDPKDLLPDSPSSFTSQEGSVMMISTDFDSPTKKGDQGQTVKQETEVIKESKKILLESLIAVCANEYNKTIKSMQSYNEETAVREQSPTPVQKPEPEACVLNQLAQTSEAISQSGKSKRFVYEDGKLTVIGGGSFGVGNSGTAETVKQVNSSAASPCPIKDKSKDSDSDCSDFELVPDVNCRWSLSGRKRPAESCSVPNVKLQNQVKETSNGTKAVEGSSLPTGRGVNECKMRPKKSAKLVERNLEPEQTDEAMTGRYNLRTTHSTVSHCLSSSNSESKDCGKNFGETRRYHLRNASQSGIVPPTTTSSKKPRLASKTPRKTTRTKCQKQVAKQSPTEIILAPNITCKWTEEYNSFLLKSKADANKDSHHKTAVPVRNVMHDRNNNHYQNGKSCNKSTTICTSSSRVIPSNRKTSTPSFLGSFAGFISDPKVPWDGKRPMRTYSGKKHVLPPIRSNLDPSL
ncbi:uncharacterized protein [Asterias amurensis]|uniref:uncharacterized protein n=1 Tax=Asterias amurensis TaxID=7602 RepID=UPI003AB3EB1D